MADTFGAITLPVASEMDPSLQALASYLAAVIGHDLTSAWGETGTARGVVVKTFTHDPERGEFNDRDLPALFLWRASSAEEPVRLADDYEIDRTRVAGLWIFPPTVQHKQVERTRVFSAVVKSLRRACRTVRHPAWLVVGDTDPEAATRGSCLLAQAEIAQLRFAGASADPPVMIEIDGARPIRYPAVHFAIELDELLAEDPAAYAGSTASEAALTLEVSVNPDRDESFPEALVVGTFEDPEEL